MYFLLPKDKLIKNIFDFTGDWDSVAERLSVIHYSLEIVLCIHGIHCGTLKPLEGHLLGLYIRKSILWLRNLVDSTLSVFWCILCFQGIIFKFLRTYLLFNGKYQY